VAATRGQRIVAPEKPAAEYEKHARATQEIANRITHPELTFL
jgi:hypothetical protein